MDGSAGERAEGPSGGSSAGDGAGRQGKRQGKRQRQDKPHNLRGDVIRKGFERRGSGNVAERAESYTDFFARVDPEAAFVEHREWLANKDDIYLVYCHLVGAGFRVDAVRIGFKAKAYYILASKLAHKDDGASELMKRTMVPISVTSESLTPKRIHLVVDDCPQYEVGLVRGGKEVTIAFVDSDSVHLLPVSGTLPVPGETL